MVNVPPNATSIATGLYALYTFIPVVDSWTAVQKVKAEMAMRAMGLCIPSYWPCVLSSMNRRALFLLGDGGDGDSGIEEEEGLKWGLLF